MADIPRLERGGRREMRYRNTCEEPRDISDQRDGTSLPDDAEGDDGIVSRVCERRGEARATHLFIRARLH